MDHNLLFIVCVLAVIPLCMAEPYVSTWLSAYFSRPVPAVELAFVKQTTGTYWQWFDTKGHLFDAKFIPETSKVVNSQGEEIADSVFHPYDVACKYDCPYDHNKG